MKALSPEEFEMYIHAGANLFDARGLSSFIEGFIPESVYFPLGGLHNKNLQYVINANEPVLLITNAGQEEEVYQALSAQGFGKIEGFLAGSFASWYEAGKTIDILIAVEVDELAMDMAFDEKLILFDIRDAIAFAKGHIQDAINIPLYEINDPVKIASIEPTENVYLYSSGEMQSAIAASVLKKHGVHNVRIVAGGWEKITQEPSIKIVNDLELLN